MEIRFNPLIAAEADAVRRFLTPGDVQQRVENILANVQTPAVHLVDPNVSLFRNVPTVIDPADNPETGAEVAQSVIPLPPMPDPASAPSTAAADLFSTAPAVPVAGIPLPPGAAIPPVPAVPATPPVAPPAPAAPANLADVDKDGLPWNAEIHASTKAKNADGRWRQKRNLDPAILERVTAQLRALMAIPTHGAGSLSETPAPVAPPAVSNIPAPPVATSAAGEPGNVIPAPPTSVPATAPIPSPPVAAPVAPSNDNAPVTFAGVMKRVTEGLRERKFGEADVHRWLKEVGGDALQIGHLAARLDLAAEFVKRLPA